MSKDQLIKNLQSQIDLQAEEIKRLNNLLENMAILNANQYRGWRGRLKSRQPNLSSKSDIHYQDDIRRS